MAFWAPRVKPHVHKQIKLKYQEEKANVRIGKDFTPKKTLDAVHERITKKWNLNLYTLSMNDTSFAMDDVAAFTQLLKACQTQIILRVKKRNQKEKEQKEKPKRIIHKTARIIINKSVRTIHKTATKLISEFFSNEMDKILQFHEMTFKNIFSDTQCLIHKNKIQSELFKNCIDCLNKVRPKSITNQPINDTRRHKVEFWQKYAYLCLIIQSVGSCMKSRIAVLSDLYEARSDLFTDNFEASYHAIVTIIDQYHALKENDDDVLFDDLYKKVSSRDIKVMVPTEMMPTSDLAGHNDNRKDTSHTTKQNTMITMDQNAYKHQPHEKSVRVYLLSPYPSHKTYVVLPEISTEWLEMRLVSPHHPHLLYLDLFHIPWDKHAQDTAIHFNCQTKAGVITIKPSKRIAKEDCGFYWIEDKRSGIQKFWDYFTTFISITKDTKSQAAQDIMTQLVNEVVNYKSFVKCSAVLLHLKTKIHPQNIDIVYDELIKNITQRHRIMDVFKMQIVNILNTRVLDIQTLYDMIKTCFIDKRSPFIGKGAHYMQLKHEIGSRIYDDFVHCAQQHFKVQNMRKLTTAQYLMLHPIYHFFRYFQDLKHRNQRNRNRRYNRHNNNRNTIVFHYHEQSNRFFSNDLKWQSMDIIDMMSLDLGICTSFNVKREYPLEFIAIRLAQIQTKNKRPFLKNILVALSTGHRADCESLCNDLFGRCSTKIFDIMADKFDFWIEIINLMQAARIFNSKVWRNRM